MVENVDKLEGVVRQSMEADNKIYNAQQEDRLRNKMWEEDFPPLPVHKRHLGTRENGTEAYAWDIKLEEVRCKPFTSHSRAMGPDHTHCWHRRWSESFTSTKNYSQILRVATRSGRLTTEPVYQWSSECFKMFVTEQSGKSIATSVHLLTMGSDASHFKATQTTLTYPTL